MPPDTFTCFLSLPKEIRDDIWEKAVANSYLDRGVHYFSVHADVPDDLRSLCLEDQHPSSPKFLPPCFLPGSDSSSSLSWTSGNPSSYASCWLPSVCRESKAAVDRYIRRIHRLQPGSHQSLKSLSLHRNPNQKLGSYISLDRDLIFFKLTFDSVDSVHMSIYPFIAGLGQSTAAAAARFPKNIAVELDASWHTEQQRSEIPGSMFDARWRVVKNSIVRWQWRGCNVWLVDRRAWLTRDLPVSFWEYIDKVRLEGFVDDLTEFCDAAGEVFVTVPQRRRRWVRTDTAEARRRMDTWKVIAELEMEYPFSIWRKRPELGLLICV